MPTAVSTQKPSTRASSRYTLNLASVGKALADVINKDMSTSEKSSKKSKEDKEAKDDAKASKTHGRRSSTVPETDTTRRRQSLNPKPLAKDVTSPPATITTRASRRLSAQPDVSAVTEDGIMLERAATISPGTARRASLRPRTNATSGLPKYRPRSMLVEPNKKQQLSPQKTRRQPSSSDAESELTGDQDLTEKRAVATRLNLRRRASDSDDESEEKRDDLKPAGLEERSKRSVSPLPKRARQPHVQVTVSPSTPVSKVKIPARKGSESPNRAVTPADQRSASPARASPAASAKAKTSSIPRPPSSGSVSSSSSAQQPTTPRTPQTPTPVRKAKKSASPGNTGSPLRHAVPRREGSPLGKFSGKSKKSQLSPVQGSPAGAEFVEGNSMDSAADVEFMLSAIASPTAPTPAIPRFRTQAFHPGLPETPLRLPARGDLSYLSPLPPGSGHSPRPLRPNHPANDRGSILSWDQLAAIGERSLGEGETRKMLADIPAPFSASSSPALSAIDLPHTPESPAMTLPSPAGYGSISQVLLPDVTPSPAPVRMQFSASSSSADQEQTSALVTMLRLQLAAQERLASERLYQMQALEAQLGTAKDARMRDAHELAGQIGTLEEQMRATLDARDRAAEEHSTRVNALEQQLAAEAGKRERAVQAAAARAAEDTARAQAASAERQGRRWMATCAAKQAGTLWEAVGDSARAETDMIEASRQTLAVLLSGLDRCQAQLFAA